MDRESTLKFLEQHVKTDVLMRHLLGVEAAMQGYARKYGEDEEEWGIAGLVHGLRLGDLSNAGGASDVRCKPTAGGGASQSTSYGQC